jgi:O-antigen ligase
VLAAAIPLLFLHARWQPAWALDLGSTTVDLTLSDLAIVAVVVAAVGAALRHGLQPLRAGVPLWLAGGALLAVVAIGVLRPEATGDAQSSAHLVSALKLVEYASLAVAVPLLLRDRDDLIAPALVTVTWTAVAAAIAVAQFLGFDVLDAAEAGWRQPSFVGHHDLAALGLLAAAAGCAMLAVRSGIRLPHWTMPVAVSGGCVALILSGSVAAAAGFALGVAALGLAAWRRSWLDSRRAVALVAVVIVVLGGVTALRADPLASFMRFLGTRDDTPREDIETYSQRSVLAYIGLRIFVDNPALGVGWQRSARLEEFLPYVDDARRRFPSVAPEAFPSPGREWGVQNAFVQAGADLGVPGLLSVAAVFVTGLVLAARGARGSPTWAGLGLTCLCALLGLIGLWNALGLVAGIPTLAATALVLGSAVTAASTAGRA